MTTLTTQASKGAALSLSEADANFKKVAQTKAGAYTVAESDNRDVIEYSGTGGDSFTLPDASTIATTADTGDFEVTIKNVGTGDLTVTCTTGTDTIDGSTSDITILVNSVVTLKVNQAANGYILTSGSTVISKILPQTVKATTSGTNIDFTSIPSWVNRVTVLFDEVSTDGAASLLIQLGDSTGFYSSGYVGRSHSLTTSTSIPAVSASLTSGIAFSIASKASATDKITGRAIIENITGNKWVVTINVTCSTGSSSPSVMGSGSITLTNELDSVRLNILSGATAYDGGQASVLYE